MSASLRLHVIGSPVKELPLERPGGKRTSGELQGRAVGSQHTLRGRGTGVGRPREGPMGRRERRRAVCWEGCGLGRKEDGWVQGLPFLIQLVQPKAQSHPPFLSSHRPSHLISQSGDCRCKDPFLEDPPPHPPMGPAWA